MRSMSNVVTYGTTKAVVVAALILGITTNEKSLILTFNLFNYSHLFFQH